MENVIGQVMIDADGQETPLVHYAYLTGTFTMSGSTKVPKIVVACQGASAILSGWQRSDDVRAVNCKVCRQTAKYQEDAGVLTQELSRLKVKPWEYL